MPPTLRSDTTSRRRHRRFLRTIFLLLCLSCFMLTIREMSYWPSFLTTPSNAASLLDVNVPNLFCDGSEFRFTGIILDIGDWYAIRNCTIPNDPHTPFVVKFLQLNSSPTDGSLTAFSISSSQFRSHLYLALPTQSTDNASSSLGYPLRIEITSCLFTGGANIILFEGSFPAGSTLSIHANTFLWSKNQLEIQNTSGLSDRTVSGIVFLNPTLSFRLTHSTIEVTHNNMSVSINNTSPTDPSVTLNKFETAFIFMSFASISLRNSTVRFDGNHLVGGVGKQAVTVHLQTTESEDDNSSIYISESSTFSTSGNTFNFAHTTEIMRAFVVAIRAFQGSFVLSGSDSYVLISNNAFDSKRGVADITPIFIDEDDSIREASVVSISIFYTLSIQQGGVMITSDNVWLLEESTPSDNPPRILTKIAVTNAFRLSAKEIALMGQGSAWFSCGNSIMGSGTNMRQIFAVRLIAKSNLWIMRSSILNVSFNSVDDVFYASRSNQHEDSYQIAAVQIETNSDASSAQGRITISALSLLSIKGNLIGFAVPCSNIPNNSSNNSSLGDDVVVAVGEPTVLHVVYVRVGTVLDMTNSRAEIEYNSIVVRRGSSVNTNIDTALLVCPNSTSTVGLDIVNGSSVVLVEAQSTITLTSSSFMRLSNNNADFTHTVPRNLRASSYCFNISSNDDPLEAPLIQSGALAVGSLVRAVDLRALGNNTNALLLVFSALEISHNTLRGFRNASRDLASVSVEISGGVFMNWMAALNIYRNLISCVYGQAFRVSAVYFAVLFSTLALENQSVLAFKNNTAELILDTVELAAVQMILGTQTSLSNRIHLESESRLEFKLNAVIRAQGGASHFAVGIIFRRSILCNPILACGSEEDSLLVDGGSSLAITGNSVTSNLVGAHFAVVLINVSTHAIRVRGTSTTSPDSPSTVDISNNAVVCKSNTIISVEGSTQGSALLRQTDTLHAVLVVANGLRIENGAAVSIADNSLSGHLFAHSSSSPPPPTRAFLYPRAVGLYINASAYRTHSASFPYSNVSTLRGAGGGDGTTFVGGGLAVVGGGAFQAVRNTIRLVNGTNAVAFLLNASFVFVSGSSSPPSSSNVSSSLSSASSRFIILGNAVVDTYTAGGQAVVAMEALVLWIEEGGYVDVSRNVMWTDPSTLLPAGAALQKVRETRSVVLCAPRVAVEGINTELVVLLNALTRISADDSTVVYLTSYARRSLAMIVRSSHAPEELRSVTVGFGAVLQVERNAANNVVGDGLSVVQFISPSLTVGLDGGVPLIVDGNGTVVVISRNRAIGSVGNVSAVVRLPGLLSIQVKNGAALNVSGNLADGPSPLPRSTHTNANASAEPPQAHVFVVVSIESLHFMSVGPSGVVSIFSNTLRNMGPLRHDEERRAYARVSLFASVRLTAGSDCVVRTQSVLAITDNTVSSSLGSSSILHSSAVSGTVVLSFGTMYVSSSARIVISRNRLNSHMGNRCFTVRLFAADGMWLSPAADGSGALRTPQLLLETNSAESILGNDVVAVFVESKIDGLELQTGALLSLSFNIVRGVVGISARVVSVQINRFSNYGTASFFGNHLSDCSQPDIGNNMGNSTHYSEKINSSETLRESTVSREFAVPRFIAVALFVTDNFEAAHGFSDGPIALRLSVNSVANVTGLSISAVLFVVSGQIAPQLSIRGQLEITSNAVQKAVGLQIRAVFLLCGFFSSVSVAAAGGSSDTVEDILSEIGTNFTLRVVSESSLTVDQNAVVDALANSVEVVALMLAREEDTNNNNDDNAAGPLSGRAALWPRFGSVCIGEPTSSSAQLSFSLNIARNVTAKRVVAALIVADGVGVRSGTLTLSFNEVNTIFTIPSDQHLLGADDGGSDLCALNNKTTASHSAKSIGGSAAVTVIAVSVTINRVLRLDNSYTCCGRSGQIDASSSVGGNVVGGSGLIMCGNDVDDDPPSYFSPDDSPRFWSLNNRVEDVHGIDLMVRSATLGFLAVSNANANLSLLLGKSSLYLAACSTTLSVSTLDRYQLVVPSPILAHRSLGTLTVADHEHSRLASLLENLGGQSSKSFYSYFTEERRNYLSPPPPRLPAAQWSGYSFIAVGNRSTCQAARQRNDDAYRSEKTTMMTSPPLCVSRLRAVSIVVFGDDSRPLTVHFAGARWAVTLDDNTVINRRSATLFDDVSAVSFTAGRTSYPLDPTSTHSHSHDCGGFGLTASHSSCRPQGEALSHVAWWIGGGEGNLDDDRVGFLTVNSNNVQNVIGGHISAASLALKITSSSSGNIFASSCTGGGCCGKGDSLLMSDGASVQLGGNSIENSLLLLKPSATTTPMMSSTGIQWCTDCEEFRCHNQTSAPIFATHRTYASGSAVAARISTTGSLFISDRAKLSLNANSGLRVAVSEQSILAHVVVNAEGNCTTPQRSSNVSEKSFMKTDGWLVPIPIPKSQTPEGFFRCVAVTAGVNLTIMYRRRSSFRLSSNPPSLELSRNKIEGITTITVPKWLYQQQIQHQLLRPDSHDHAYDNFRCCYANDISALPSSVEQLSIVAVRLVEVIFGGYMRLSSAIVSIASNSANDITLTTKLDVSESLESSRSCSPQSQAQGLNAISIDHDHRQAGNQSNVRRRCTAPPPSEASLILLMGADGGRCGGAAFHNANNNNNTVGIGFSFPLTSRLHLGEESHFAVIRTRVENCRALFIYRYTTPTLLNASNTHHLNNNEGGCTVESGASASSSCCVFDGESAASASISIIALVLDGATVGSRENASRQLVGIADRSEFSVSFNVVTVNVSYMYVSSPYHHFTDLRMANITTEFPSQSKPFHSCLLNDSLCPVRGDNSTKTRGQHVSLFTAWFGCEEVAQDWPLQPAQRELYVSEDSDITATENAFQVFFDCEPTSHMLLNASSNTESLQCGMPCRHHHHLLVNSRAVLVQAVFSAGCSAHFANRSSIIISQNVVSSRLHAPALTSTLPLWNSTEEGNASSYAHPFGGFASLFAVTRSKVISKQNHDSNRTVCDIVYGDDNVLGIVIKNNRHQNSIVFALSNGSKIQIDSNIVETEGSLSSRAFPSCSHQQVRNSHSSNSTTGDPSRLSFAFVDLEEVTITTIENDQRRRRSSCGLWVRGNTFSRSVTVLVKDYGFAPSSSSATTDFWFSSFAGGGNEGGLSLLSIVSLKAFTSSSVWSDTSSEEERGEKSTFVFAANTVRFPFFRYSEESSSASFISSAPLSIVYVAESFSSAGGVIISDNAVSTTPIGHSTHTSEGTVAAIGVGCVSLLYVGRAARLTSNVSRIAAPNRTRYAGALEGVDVQDYGFHIGEGSSAIYSDESIARFAAHGAESLIIARNDVELYDGCVVSGDTFGCVPPWPAQVPSRIEGNERCGGLVSIGESLVVEESAVLYFAGNKVRRSSAPAVATPVSHRLYPMLGSDKLVITNRTDLGAAPLVMFCGNEVFGRRQEGRHNRTLPYAFNKAVHGSDSSNFFQTCREQLTLTQTLSWPLSRTVSAEPTTTVLCTEHFLCDATRLVFGSSALTQSEPFCSGGERLRYSSGAYVDKASSVGGADKSRRLATAATMRARLEQPEGYANDTSPLNTTAAVGINESSARATATAFVEAVLAASLPLSEVYDFASVAVRIEGPFGANLSVSARRASSSTSLPLIVVGVHPHINSSRGGLLEGNTDELRQYPHITLSAVIDLLVPRYETPVGGGVVNISAVGLHTVHVSVRAWCGGGDDQPFLTVTSMLELESVLVYSPVKAGPGRGEVTKGLGTASGVAVVAIGGVALPVSAMQQGVAMALLRMMQCGGEALEGEPLDVLVHPLQFAMGTGPTAYARGAIIGNLVVVPLVWGALAYWVAPYVVYVAMRGRLGSDGPNLQQSSLSLGALLAFPFRASTAEGLLGPYRDFVGWPGVLSVPMATLAEGSAMTSVGLLTAFARGGGSGLDALLGAVGVVVLVLGAAAWSVSLLRVVRLPSRKCACARSLPAAAFPSWRWLVQPRWEWALKRHGGLFEAWSEADAKRRTAVEGTTSEALLVDEAGDQEINRDEEGSAQEMLEEVRLSEPHSFLVRPSSPPSVSSFSASVLYHNDSTSTDAPLIPPMSPAEASYLRRRLFLVGDSWWLWSGALSFVFSLIVGVAEGMPTDSVALCRLRWAVAAVGVVGQSLAVLTNTVPLEVALLGLASILSCALVGFVAVSAFESSGGELSEAASVAVNGIGSVSAVLGILLMVVGVVGAVYEMIRDTAARFSTSPRSVKNSKRVKATEAFGTSQTQIAACESPRSRRGVLNIDDDDETRSDSRDGGSEEPEAHEEVAVLGSPSELVLEEEKEEISIKFAANAVHSNTFATSKKNIDHADERLTLTSDKGDNDHRLPSPSRRREVLEARWRSILDEAEAEAELVAIRRRTKKKLPS